MANWSNLKSVISDAIKTNGNQEITGALLQSTLTNIVNAVGENATFAGIATPTTNPGTPDGPIFYFAKNAGVYSNFNSIVVASGQVVVLYNNTGTWSKEVLINYNADSVTYDNSTSGLEAVTAQGALDEASSIAHFAKRGSTINISTNYNSLGTAEVLTLKQAIAKVPVSDRVLGFVGRFYSSNGWETCSFNGENLTEWSDESKWSNSNIIKYNKHYSDSEQLELDNLINTNTCEITEGDIINGTYLGNYGINVVTGEMVEIERYRTYEYDIDARNAGKRDYIKIYQGSWTNKLFGTIFLDEENNIIASYRARTNGWKTIHIPYNCAKIKTFYIDTEREVRYVTVKPISSSVLSENLNETKKTLNDTINNVNNVNNSLSINSHNVSSKAMDLDNSILANTCEITDGNIIEGTELGAYEINGITGEVMTSVNKISYEYNLEVPVNKDIYIKIYVNAFSDSKIGTVFLDNNGKIILSYRPSSSGWKYFKLPYKCSKLRTTYSPSKIEEVRYVTVKPISSSVLSENLNETKETLNDTINNVNNVNNSLSISSYNVSSKAMDLDNSILANTCEITDGNIIEGTELGAYEINGITGEVMTSVNKISYEYNLEVPVNKDIYIKIYVNAFSDSKIGTVFLDNNGKIILSYRPSSRGWKYFKLPYKCSKLRTTYSPSKIEEVRYVTVKPIDVISIRDNIQEQINNEKENTTWDIAYHSRNAIMCSYGIEPSYSILSRFCASRELGNNLRTKLVDIREYLGSTWYGEAYIAEKDGFIYAAGMYNMYAGEHGDQPIAIKLTKINKSDMSIVGSVDVTRCDKSLDAELTNEDGVITYNYSSYNPMIFFAENIIRVIYSTGQDNKDGSQIIHTVKYSDFDVELNLIKNDFCKIKTVDGTLLNMTWSSIQSAFGFSGRGHFTVGYCGYDSDSAGKKYLGIASGVGPFCVIATTDDFITYEIKKHIDNKYDCSFENSIVIDGDILFHAIRTQYITRTDTIRKRRVLWVQKLKLDTLEIIDEIAIPDCNTMPRLFKDSKGDIFLFCGANASSQLKYYVSADRDYYKLIKIDKYDLASSYMLCDTNGVQLTNLSLFMDSEIEDNFYVFINKGYIAKFTIPSYRVGKANDMIDKLMAL